MSDTTHQLARWIEYRPLTELPDHPDNPRIHNLDELIDSIKRFGFTTPLLLDSRTGMLAEGHGRKKAALALWQEQADVPPGVERAADGHWYVPVVVGWGSRDDIEARAYLIAGNQAGGYDDRQLIKILSELADMDAMSGVGFNADDLDTLLAGLDIGELPEQDTDADHADHPDRGEPAPPRTNQGLHEVGLMFSADAHREYRAAIAVLAARWGLDTAPDIVLRSLRAAVATD